MLDIGINIVKGIWQGIQDTGKWLWGKLTGWIGDVVGWLTGKDGFDEHSPSKVTEGIGKRAVQGLALGFTKNAGLVNKAMESMVPDKTSMAMDVTRRFNDSYTLGTRKQSTMSVSLSDSAVGQIINGFKAALTDQGDTVLIMNDREFGRAVRKVALA